MSWFNSDEFVIMACDGVWDVMANDEACFFLRKSIQEGNRDLGKILEDMEVGVLGWRIRKIEKIHPSVHPLTIAPPGKFSSSNIVIHWRGRTNSGEEVLGLEDVEAS